MFLGEIKDEFFVGGDFVGVEVVVLVFIGWCCCCCGFCWCKGDDNGEDEDIVVVIFVVVTFKIVAVFVVVDPCIKEEAESNGDVGWRGELWLNDGGENEERPLFGGGDVVDIVANSGDFGDDGNCCCFWFCCCLFIQSKKYL